MDHLLSIFRSVLRLSPWTLIIGIAISVVSSLDAFNASKDKYERLQKSAIAMLSISLLVIQAGSNERSGLRAQQQLQAALAQQREQFTGTVDNAVLGSTLCPWVFGEAKERSHDVGFVKPDSINFVNPDLKLNMYDLHIRAIEYGPSANGLWSKKLQEKQLTVPFIAPQKAALIPFHFLSEMSVIDVQIDLDTRAGFCSGRIELRDTGHNHWIDQTNYMYKGGSVQYSFGDRPLGGYGHESAHREAK